MNLIIDIGNTNVKLAVFSQEEMLYLIRVKHFQVVSEIKLLAEKFEIQQAIISQVGTEIAFLKDFLKEKKIKFMLLTSDLILPFGIKYKTPKTIGADRLALVAGAILKQPDTNKLIIDAGTCITYDFVDNKNSYFGGAISPGLYLRYKSLNDYTANLPRLHIPASKIDLIGTDTKSSIQSGVVNGTLNEIETFIVKYSLKYKDLTVFLTGGDEKVFAKYVKNKIFANSKFILLEGMNYILNLNIQTDES